MGDFEFHEENWDHISTGAKDVIIELLNTNPGKRATAKDILEHPWLKTEKKILKMKNLQKSQVSLKKHLAKQRFRKAINTVSVMLVKTICLCHSMLLNIYYCNVFIGAIPTRILWGECSLLRQEEG